jgi:hypothetical protein
MTTALIIIAAILCIIILVSLAMGFKMNIEKEVLIQKPSSEVFDYLKLVRNQDKFSVWNMADPDMSKTFIGVDGTVGSIYSWDSPTNKNVGAGSQEIISITEGKQIEYELRFERPMKNTAKSKIMLEAVSASETRVIWGFYSNMKFPMNVAKPIFVNMLGKDLQKSLINLKVLLEK